ncbi:aminotransferase class I/II-fold pyridoxal phosphate-dependent enzyme [Clostridium sp. YIM B02515]|uniref:Aminotransferase class I/II-fold pyridoxal phosphate-dependent enzyme n=1 Tax=Clostridium rhizosphaerae TaxID=2803861 RepID=A0ABS1T6M6_9CLOT|nr:aminotransferase class I/II-fold pyridoxal phosphate-dependent enzyme [Clostridium rhizosphaerae]MBL4934960.1 aminotransferase class I/II-fold pyridoxal phosphate-dependent enzyme [Clostridium rhizosphaerae]
MSSNNRLNSISEYHFQKLDILKKKLINDGKKIVDLSIGDPDLEVDKSIIQSLIEGFNVNGYNKYPPYDGIEELKLGIINYYREIYNVKLTLDEVLILIGSKEGINNIIPAVCDIGDYAIVPNPGYPVYSTCCHLWGVNTYNIVLKENNSYLPHLGDIDKKVLDKCRLFAINYPNNPTGATANSDFYKEIVEFCNNHNIIIYNDAAYNEIIKKNEAPLSILQFDPQKKCVEFGTFSKTYNMTGFRIGYVVGNSRVISSLLKVKSNVDSGQFIPIQYAAIAALKLSRDYVNSIRNTYEERKKITKRLLYEHNIEFFDSEGTFYLWCKTPAKFNTEKFCEELLNAGGLVVTPGNAFGDAGADNFRIALTRDKMEIFNAFNKISVY